MKEKFPKICKSEINKLANAISKWRYDNVAYFIEELSYLLSAEAERDYERKRYLLSKKLFDSSNQLGEVSDIMLEIWEICKPFCE